MKYSFLISCLFIILFSCKKEGNNAAESPNNLIGKIKVQLKDSISVTDFRQLDFDHAVETHIPKVGQIFLRIPFINKSLASDFLLLKIENNGIFSSGKFFNINKNIQKSYKKSNTKFNGNIKIYSLKRNLLTSSFITNGFVDAFYLKQNNTNFKEDVVVIPLMPEVVVVCSPPGGGGGTSWNYYDYYDLPNLLYGGGDGGGQEFGSSYGGYYSNSLPSQSGSGNPPPNTSQPNNPTTDDPILIYFELVESLEAININDYLQCFSSIPDNGALCSVKILTDIPVDNDPNKFFDWSVASPGHTFLQLTKSNGSQSVQQNIGFYPVKGWKTMLSPAPEEAKFVDNQDHEFNASLLMNLTPKKFESTLTHIKYLSAFIKYDLANYNCTDFALEVFNYQRGGGNKLAIPMYDIPGGNAPMGTATPQGLYQKLQEMQSNNSAEAPNITIPGVKAYAGSSDGPCN